MKISILCDNMNSWIFPYAEMLVNQLKAYGHDAVLLNDAELIPHGDIAAFLSCENIIRRNILDRSKNNIVVHESDLPKGKGWSPMTWQVLENKKHIPITLFEAVEKVDAGPIYLQDTINLKGTELIEDIRKLQGEKTVEMILTYVSEYPNNSCNEQIGESTFYDRRTPKDSELDIHDSILNQFNLLRVVDNERYPAFFEHLGEKYIVKIYKEE